MTHKTTQKKMYQNLRFLLLLAFLALYSNAFAQLKITPSFEPAETGRTHMDIGGVWNGSQNIAPGDGDKFTLKVKNTSSKPAKNIKVSVALGDTNFKNSPTTISATASPCAAPTGTLNFTRTGDTLSITLPASYSLAAGCELTLNYKLHVDKAIPKGGSYKLDYKVESNQGDSTKDFNVVVKPAALLIKKTVKEPTNGKVKPGDSVKFDVEIINTGSGAIFDTIFEDTLQDGLKNFSFVGGAPTKTSNNNDITTTNPTPAGVNAQQKIEYLASNESWKFEVKADVAGCKEIANFASVKPQAGTKTVTETSGFDSVIFELQNPEVDYTVNDVTLDNTGKGQVKVDIKNNKYDANYDTSAFNFAMESTLHKFSDITVSNVASGWKYDSATGIFNYDPNNDGKPDKLPASAATTTLTFDVSIPQNNCPAAKNYSIGWLTRYDNFCTNPSFVANYPNQKQAFTPPVKISKIKTGDLPTIKLNKTNKAGGRIKYIKLGDTNTYTINVPAVTGAGSLPAKAGANNDFTLTDILPDKSSSGLSISSIVDTISISNVPSGVTLLVGGAAYTPGSNIPINANITLSGENSALASGFSLDINYKYKDTQNNCEFEGEYITNKAEIKHAICTGTQYEASDNAITVINTPSGSARQVKITSRDLKVFGSVANSTTGTPIETGLKDDDKTVNNKFKEGEAITYESTYTMDKPSTQSSGVWTGSTFTGELESAIETYIEDSLKIEVTINGTKTTFSPTLTGSNKIVPDSTSPKLIVPLDNIKAALGNDSVDGATLKITYKTTVVNTTKTKSSTAKDDFFETTSLKIASSAGSNCGTRVRQTKNVEIVRANPSVSLTGLPGIIDACQEIPMTATVNPPSNKDTRAHNLELNIDLSNYKLLTTPAVAVTGGMTPSSPANFSPSGTLKVGPTKAQYEYKQGDDKTETKFKIRYIPNSSAPGTPANLPSNLGATLKYNDRQGDNYTATASAKAAIVREAKLIINVSPQSIPITSKRIEWEITISNTGTGNAYKADVIDIVPEGIKVLPAASDDVNGSLSGGQAVAVPTNTTNVSDTPVTVVGGRTWKWEDIDYDRDSSNGLTPIPPGKSFTFKVVGEVQPTACSLGNEHKLETHWGCSGYKRSKADIGPKFSKLEDNIEIVHDTTKTKCSICGTGTVYIKVRNTGGVDLSNLIVTEDLTGSGLTYVANSTEISFDGGTNFTNTGISNPAISGSKLTWDKTKIPALQELYSIYNATNSKPQAIIIKFQVKSPGESLDPAKKFQANVTYDVPCKQDRPSKDSPGVPLNDIVTRPKITVKKQGRNKTAGESTSQYKDKVYGGKGDKIIWKITIKNDGDEPAQDIAIRDVITAGNMTIDYINTADNASSGNITAKEGSFPSKDVTAYRDTNLPDIAKGATATYYVYGTITDCATNVTNKITVEWGCKPIGSNSDSKRIAGTTNTNINVAGPGGISKPTNNTATSDVIITPAIQAKAPDIVQDITLGSNGTIKITVKNNGGTAKDFKLTDTLPTGYSLDATVNPTVTSSGSYTGKATQATVSGTATVPVFEFKDASNNNAILRNQETITLTFAVVQTGLLDNTKNPEKNPETVANSLDPKTDNELENKVKVSFKDSCTKEYTPEATKKVTPKIPDLDIDINGSKTRVVTGVGSKSTFDVKITNAGGGAAENGKVTIAVGAGWKIETGKSLPTGCSDAGGSGSPMTITCTSSALGNIAPGGSKTLSIPLEVENTSNPLTFVAEVQGDIYTKNAPSGGGSKDTDKNYSLDSVAATVSGFNISKKLISCTEPDSPDNLSNNNKNADVIIGEDCTYRIKAEWFGTGSKVIKGAKITDSISDGLGYISDTGTVVSSLPNSTDAGTAITVKSKAPNGIVDGTTKTFKIGTTGRPLNWNLHNFTAPTKKTLTIDVVLRVLNKDIDNQTGPVQHTKLLRNTAKSTYTVQIDTDTTKTFNDRSTGYPKAKDRRVNVKVLTPKITMTKEVSKVPTSATSYSNLAEGESGDTFQYKIFIKNDGADRAPAYDLELKDTLPPNTKLTILAFSGDGVDNDNEGGNGESNGEGNVTGQTITFNKANTGNLKFDKLGANDTITLLYRVKAQIGVNPNEVLKNKAELSYDTLPGASGSQNDPKKPSGDILGARKYTKEATADIKVKVVLQQAKELITQDVNTDNWDFSGSGTGKGPINSTKTPLANVVIGEQLTYRLTVILPFGTTENFKITDQLPAGMALASYEGVLQTDITCTPALTKTPATPTPTTGGTKIEWNFGTCKVEAGKNNKITVKYKANVLNVSGNVQNTKLKNGAKFSYKNMPSTTEQFKPVTVNVIEPKLEISKKLEFNPTTKTSGDAGDKVTVTLEVKNTGPATAYDVEVTDLLNDKNNDGTVDDTVFNCSTATNKSTGGETFNLSSCLVKYSGFELAKNATKTLKFEVELSSDINVGAELTYNNTGKTTASSLPSTATNNGEKGLERNGKKGVGDDDGFDTKFKAESTTSLKTVAPKLTKTFTAHSDKFTPINNDNPKDNNAKNGNIAIGEAVTVNLVYTIPEGKLKNVKLQDVVVLGSNAAQIELVKAKLLRTGNLTSVKNPKNINGSADVDLDIANDISTTGSVISLELGDVTNPDTDNAKAETYTLQLTYRLKNHADNQAGKTLTNTPQLVADDNDKKTQTTKGISRNLTVVEPKLNVTKAVAPSGTTVTVGDTLTYTVTITNDSGAKAIAYDINIVDTLPQGLVYVGGSVTTTDGNPNSGGTSLANVDFGNPSITGNGTSNAQVLKWGREKSAAQKIDIAPGGELKFTYKANVMSVNGEIKNKVDVDYTSLNGTNDGFDKFEERTGADGVPTDANNTTPLNNYKVSATTKTNANKPKIGLSKELTTLGNNGNGTYDAGFSLKVTNHGDTELTDVQIIDDLIATFPSPAVVNGVSALTITGDLPATAINTGFNGNSDKKLLKSGQKLAAGKSATINFLVTFTPNKDNAAYNNTAKATSKDPNNKVIEDVSQNGTNDDPDGDKDPTNNNEPTPLAVGSQPQIGLAKALSGIIDNGNGSYTVSFVFKVKNTGTVPLEKVQITDNLKTTFPNPATFSVVQIVPDPFTTKGKAGLNANSSFTGDSDDKLLSGADKLIVGDEASISLVVLLNPNQATGDYKNTAVASGESAGGTKVTDTSHDGKNVDPEGNGPSDNSTPTPIKLSSTPIKPVVGIAKKVLSVKTKADDPNIAAGDYRVKYQIKVENLGKVKLVDVAVVDNFKQSGLTNPIGNILKSGSVQVTEITSLNSTIYGVTSSEFADSLAVNSAFDGVNQTLLTDAANSTLDIGKVAVIEVTLDVTPPNGAFVNNGQTQTNPYNNQAEVTAKDPNRNDTADDKSDDGNNTDFNGNNNPKDTGENDPTPVIFSKGNGDIKIQKYQLICTNKDCSGDSVTPGSTNNSTQNVQQVIPAQSFIVYTIEGKVNKDVKDLIITDIVPQPFEFVNGSSLNSGGLECSTAAIVGGAKPASTTFATANCSGTVTAVRVKLGDYTTTQNPAPKLQFVVKVP